MINTLFCAIFWKNRRYKFTCSEFFFFLKYILWINIRSIAIFSFFCFLNKMRSEIWQPLPRNLNQKLCRNTFSKSTGESSSYSFNGTAFNESFIYTAMQIQIRSRSFKFKLINKVVELFNWWKGSIFRIWYFFWKITHQKHFLLFLNVSDSNIWTQIKYHSGKLSLMTIHDTTTLFFLISVFVSKIYSEAPIKIWGLLQK